MKIRAQTLNDLMLLEKSAKFPLGLKNYDQVFSVTQNDGELVGSAMLSTISEVSMILRNDLSPITKSKALLKINEVLLKHLKGTDVHVIVKDHDSYVNILKKHLGFEEIEGVTLFKRV